MDPDLAFQAVTYQCLHCDADFDGLVPLNATNSELRQTEAFKECAAHEAICEQNPQVQRIRTLEAQVESLGNSNRYLQFTLLDFHMNLEHADDYVGLKRAAERVLTETMFLKTLDVNVANALRDLKAALR